MSEFVAPSHEVETAVTTESPTRPLGLRRRRTAHRDALRFHLLLNLSLAIGATWVLKLDGPYYADGIAAGIFVVGFLIAIWSFRTIRRSEATVDDKGVSTSPVFLALALFFLAAAGAVIWFTYIAPPDPVYTEDGVAQLRLSLRGELA